MKMFNRLINAILLLMILSMSVRSQPVKLVAGTYTESNEKGLYLLDLNLESGTFKMLSKSDAGPNPSYFCISEKNGMIYAANEVMNFNGLTGGGVTALKYNDKGKGIEKIKQLAVPNGSPCYISLSPGNDYLFLANFTGGSVAVIKLDAKGIPVSLSDTILYKGEGGKVSHAHMISFDPEGKKVYLTDLGLDRIVIYDFENTSGHLIKNSIFKLPEGTGPRHFVFSADGNRMYVIGESSSTVSVLEVDGNGGLKLIQTISTTRKGYAGQNACADLHISKDGKFLYGSNRGENTIVTFRIGSGGSLTLSGHSTCGGDWPRNFVIDPSGKNILVANQRTGNISLFRIDEKSGIPVESGVEYKMAAPVCLKFYNIK
jgi:6-phosphogluconolactonase